MANPFYEIPKTPEEIGDYLATADNEPDHVVSIDTETDGLDSRKCKLAGVSISASPNTAMYIPVGHEVGSHLNLPIVEVTKQLVKGVGERKCIFWNAKFDLPVLSRNTGWAPVDNFLDAIELPYLDNPERRVGLKFLAKEILNVDMQKFEEIFDDPDYYSRFGKKKKTKDLPLIISYIHPQKALSYAGADADLALQLYYHFRYILSQYEGAVRVDTALVNVLMDMEQLGGLDLNGDYITEKLVELDYLTEFLNRQILDEAGFDFDVNSPKQVANALFVNLGLPPQGHTKTGQLSTDAQALESLAKQYPIAEWLILYKKLTKARNTYFKKLKYLIDNNQKPFFQFNQYAVPTYRFSSSGGDPEKDGTVGINIQAVSNGEIRDTWGVDVTPNPYFDYPDDQLEDRLPYVLPSDDRGLVCIRRTCDGCPAKCEDYNIDVTRKRLPSVQIVPSVRQAFTAPKGYTLASFDYDRQEIVIAANFSKEPVWIEALKEGADIHAVMATRLFGLIPGQCSDKEWDQARKKAKTINFGIIYGLTPPGLAARLGISLKEGEELYNDFFSVLRSLKRWLDHTVYHAKKDRYVRTYWGRRRWIDRIMQDNMGHAERVAMNTPIQGTGAEVTRLAMVYVNKWLHKYDPQLQKARMVYTLHDELGILIQDDYLLPVVMGVKKCMEFRVKSWEIQLSTGCKIGVTWGEQEEVDWGDWVGKYESA